MLHVIANTRFFLTAFVMERLQGAEGVRVLPHGSHDRGLTHSLAKFAEASLPWAGLRSRAFAAGYLAQLRAIEPTDSVLVFGVENIKELRILRRHIRARRRTLFTWNPVRDYQQNPLLRLVHIRALKGLGMEVVTFDPEDAQRHGLRLVDQVYRDVSPYQEGDVAQDIDLYFVGQDKGRMPTLARLHAAARQAGLRVHFHITPDRQRAYTAQERALLTPAPLPYAENLAWVRRARCLLEVVQPHQSGPTVRSLEAAFFGKKLLTTRAAAVRDDLYTPGRVFVDGHDAPDRLGDFMQAPHPPIPPALLARHDMLHWHRQFI
ncbi:MAG: hypothetical protein ABT02_13380 [Comamonadaceae bacterium SCN 68-20]|nr:MAG: hypothetical protein ABT02_13380 [Comamonadaceae bacterium SCN 68-20]